MQIISNPDREMWHKFVAEHSSPSSFLQSWEWGEFQKELGNKVYRVAEAGENGAYIAAAQAVVRPLYFGKTYLEITKGPVVRSGIENNESRIKEFLEEIQIIAKRENAILIRMNPPYTEPLFSILYSKFSKPQILLRQTEPEDTVLVDLTKSEDELMAAMHEKSRYNIRLALKKGVKVEEKTGDRPAFDKFLELIEETAKRDGITVWPRARFEKFREQFMINNSPQPSLSLREGVPPLNLRGGEGELLNSPRAILLTGEYEGKVLAAAIVMLFGDSGTYLYAASSAQQRNANVPSLVLWEAIRAAKVSGKKYYDMWGIAPQGAPENHPWSGITRFKSRYVTIGKTGIEEHYLGTRDLILNKPFYTLFKIAKKLRG